MSPATALLVHIGKTIDSLPSVLYNLFKSAVYEGKMERYDKIDAMIVFSLRWQIVLKRLSSMPAIGGTLPGTISRQIQMGKPRSNHLMKNYFVQRLGCRQG